MKRTLVRPLGDRVVVREHAQPEVSATGRIVIPDAANDQKPYTGIVVAVGTGLRLESGAIVPLIVKVDDVVQYSRYTGSTIKIDGVPHLMFREEELLGIVETYDDGLPEPVEEAPPEA